jgi:hypothetical protein
LLSIDQLQLRRHEPKTKGDPVPEPGLETSEPAREQITTAKPAAYFTALQVADPLQAPRAHGMNVSLARRLAPLEARLKALQQRKDVEIVVKEFAQPAPAQERAEGAYRLHACPGECGGRVRTGEERCSTCGAALTWLSLTTGEAI